MKFVRSSGLAQPRRPYNGPAEYYNVAMFNWEVRAGSTSPSDRYSLGTTTKRLKLTSSSIHYLHKTSHSRYSVLPSDRHRLKYPSLVHLLSSFIHFTRNTSSHILSCSCIFPRVLPFYSSSLRTCLAILEYFHSKPSSDLIHISLNSYQPTYPQPKQNNKMPISWTSEADAKVRTAIHPHTQRTDSTDSS